MASSSLHSQSSCKYDVFISFRGDDTRKTFVDHLYTAIRDRLISVYKDDDALPRGDSIGQSLFKAIEEAEIAIVIFSENYADSSWCLEELAHIMKCKEERNLIVMPVFYGVDPSEVRKQKRKFGEAFAKHEVENANKAESRRKALVDASEISGWDPKNIANGHESKAIKEIVDTISYKLFSLTSGVDEEFVGMKTRLQELEEQLEIGSSGVLMVGIWGVGGGGKTTLATYLYMKINSRFEGHCIVDSIREDSAKKGLKILQETMLSSLSKTKIAVQSVEEGKTKIRNRLRRSKVLIILDDVDHIDQLDALAGTRSWFGNGSRIVITTRNEQLLKAHKVDRVCHVTLLTREEAIELFNKRAYDEKRLVKDYETLSLSVVSYCAGLPLALKLLGSSLCGRDEKMWKSTLARLKDIPEMGIMEKLKISYDGLDTDEKALFLDIACFFRGWFIRDMDEDDDNFDSDGAMDRLKAFGYHIDIGIEVLKQKALVYIKDGRFDMHDLVKEMAHYIVRGEHPNNPENHSRIWEEKDIRSLCFGDRTMENDKIEVILSNALINVDRSLFCKMVSKMKKLRWIEVPALYNNDEANIEGPDFLSSELQYINWSSYSRSPFPDSFVPTKLVFLKLQRGLQKELWDNSKHLPRLKVLHLVHMKNLLKTPNFDELPCLVMLSIHDCKELEEIHPSFGDHRSLKHVIVSQCGKLDTLPTIVKMEKLKTFKIWRCHENLEFPEIKSNMESLVRFSLTNVGIDALLSSIGERCANLVSLKLVRCSYSKSSYSKSKEVNFDRLNHLKEFRLNSLYLRNGYGSELSIWLRGVFVHITSSLQKLDLRSCDLRDEEIPSDVGKLSNLQELDLGYNAFTRFHFSLVQLTQLKKLNLSGCQQLTELPELPSGLLKLSANGCTELTTVGDVYKNCQRLCLVSIKSVGIIIDARGLLEFMLQGNTITNHSRFLTVRGVEIAKGSMPPLLSGSSKCTLKLPENWCNDFCGFLMCVVLTSNDFHRLIISVKNQETSDTNSTDDVVWNESDNDNTTLVWYVPFSLLRQTQWWDESGESVLFDVYSENECRGFGVRMVTSESGSDQLRETVTTQEESQYSSHVYNDSVDGFELTLPDELVWI